MIRMRDNHRTFNLYIGCEYPVQKVDEPIEGSAHIMPHTLHIYATLATCITTPDGSWIGRNASPNLLDCRILLNYTSFFPRAKAQDRHRIKYSDRLLLREDLILRLPQRAAG